MVSCPALGSVTWRVLAQRPVSTREHCCRDACCMHGPIMLESRSAARGSGSARVQSAIRRAQKGLAAIWHREACASPKQQDKTTSPNSHGQLRSNASVIRMCGLKHVCWPCSNMVSQDPKRCRKQDASNSTTVQKPANLKQGTKC